MRDQYSPLFWTCGLALPSYETPLSPILAMYDSSRHILVSHYHARPAIASLWPTIATCSQPQPATSSCSKPQLATVGRSWPEAAIALWDKLQQPLGLHIFAAKSNPSRTPFPTPTKAPSCSFLYSFVHLQYVILIYLYLSAPCPCAGLPIPLAMDMCYSIHVVMS